jgi:quercetin dioxygenase-like cupin family protein
MREKFLVSFVALGIAYSGFAKAQQEPWRANDSAATHVMLTPDSIKWQPLPPEWADGPPQPEFRAQSAIARSEVAIVQGDPTKEGLPFVIRIRSTPGTKLPPHWHPIDEHITVLSGVFCVGTGDKFDEHACRDMPAGSYIVLPKGMHHFGLAKGDIIQVHGIGPFKIYWVK